MSRRSDCHCAAPAGRMITGRKNPQVRGMFKELRDSRRQTARLILKEFESVRVARIQASSKRGVARAETQARRARPAVSLSSTKKEPAAQNRKRGRGQLLE